MKNKDYVKNFDSFVDSLLENRDIKKGTPQFDLIKKNILSFKELFESEYINEEGSPVGSLNFDDLLEKFLGQNAVALTKTEAEFKSKWAIYRWYEAKGDPKKSIESPAIGKDSEIADDFDENWKKLFGEKKVTMKQSEMKKCLEHWSGIMSSASGVELDAIKDLEDLTDPNKVKKIVDSLWKKADGYPESGTTYNLWDEKFVYPSSEIKFDKDLIVEKSKKLLEKAKSVLDGKGKNGRMPLSLIPDKDCVGLFPDTSFNLVMSREEQNKYEVRGRQAYENDLSRYSKPKTASFWIWYSIISDEKKFDKLLARLEDPKYIKSSFLKITKEDKLEILNGIWNEALENFQNHPKSSLRKSIKPFQAILGAESIVWWPKKAVETMPSSIVQPTEGGQTPEVEKIWDFAWPYAQKDGENLAMTYFKNDSATIEDGRDKDVANAVKMIMDKIKSDKGELLKLTYRIVASTSDEPSKYQQNGVIGGDWLPKNNEYLVVARAKTIEDALNKAITTYSIPKEKVTKDTEALSPNNTLGGTAVYEKMKSMRSGTEQQKADYKKLFAQPKHSGILFNIEYLTKDSGETPPDEEVVQPYSVAGEWVYEITWSVASSTKRKRRRTRSRKPIKGINWGKLFPDIPVGGGSSVRDLCAAYG